MTILQQFVLENPLLELAVFTVLLLGFLQLALSTLKEVSGLRSLCLEVNTKNQIDAAFLYVFAVAVKVLTTFGYFLAMTMLF